MTAGCASASGSSAGRAEVTDAGGASEADAGAASERATDAATEASPTIEVTVSATVDGRPFHAAGGAAEQGFTFARGTSSNAAGLSVLIGEYPAMCSAPRVVPSLVLHLELMGSATPNLDAGMVATGSYALGNANAFGENGAILQVVALATDPEGLFRDEAGSGTVVLTRNDQEAIEGTFDATLTRSGHAQGSFRIVPCAGAPMTPNGDDGTAKPVLDEIF